MIRHFAHAQTIRFCLCVAALFVMLASPLYAVSATGTSGGDNDFSSQLDKQVRGWVSDLASKQPFVSWKNAVPDIQALGPGTHAWYVLLTAKGRVVGYMVVDAAPDGSFRLGEYGTGPSVLFSPSALKRTLTINGLIGSGQARYTATRHYLQPFAAVWEVAIGGETYWMDGKTNEILPIDRLLWDTQFPKTIGAAPVPASGAGGISSLWRKNSFDPYERLPWLTGEQPYPVTDVKKVQSRIRSSLHLRYVTEPFGDAALYAVPVIGFQRWSGGRLDLTVDMAGDRFIPLNTLRAHGEFYR